MGKAVKPLTKSQIISELAEQSGLTKKDVTAVLEAMSGLITTAVSKKGPGQFTRSPSQSTSTRLAPFGPTQIIVS